MAPVYITSLGSFLPGEPVPNEEMSAYLGPINRKQEVLRKAALARNGIKQRHYAIDRTGTPLLTNAQIAAKAGRQALLNGEVDPGAIDLLCAAASQGDLLAPGFASMVHAELDLPETEVASFASFCASGVMALKSAYTSIRGGDSQTALVCASEFASRFLRDGYLQGATPSPDTEFLRWTLSDGGGAALLENRPRARGQSLRIDFIDLKSYANRFDVCMYGGGRHLEEEGKTQPWSNFPSIEAAHQAGAFHLRQNFSLLENLIPLGMERYLTLVEDGKIDPDALDWVLVHFSSDHFRKDLIRNAEEAGVRIREDRFFTNLYETGNTGSASIFVMLDEIFAGGRLRDGDRILCMVPESGRFIVSFFQLTVVGDPVSGEAEVRPESLRSDASQPKPVQWEESSVERLHRRLGLVWLEFERELNGVPIIDKLNRGKLRVEDYRLLLRDLRQQVVEGARWIARAASNITAEWFDLRSIFIGHAHDEHRDFQMLEQNYVSVGGDLAEIQAARKNVGSEALSAWMFHMSSKENPIELLGAMFIIEGLGNRLAATWGKMIQQQLDLEPDQVSFLLYHGANDEDHLERLWDAFRKLGPSEEQADAIVKAAKVTARLYRLQLEELGNR